MARPLQRPDLAVVMAVTLFAIAVLWLVLEISGSPAPGVPQIAAPASAAEPAAAASRPARAPVPEPAGRQNPLIALPDSGTPVLAVKGGAAIALRSKPGGDVAATLGDRTEFGSPTVLTVLERKGNWVGVPTEKLPNGQLGWVKLGSDDFSVDSVDAEVVIDLSSMTGELRRGGRAERRWQVGIGAAGTETPTGHFSITDELENTFNPAYGCCVLPISASQPNLPSGWAGGNRMALHGTSAPLGAANSTGCVHIGETDLRALMDELPLGTPVTIKS